MANSEIWLKVVGLGRMGREVLNTFCSEVNDYKDTGAEFFYLDKSFEIEEVREAGKLRMENVYSLEEVDRSKLVTQRKFGSGTLFVAGLGGFKTGARALVELGKEITSYYRSKGEGRYERSIAVVSLPFDFEGRGMRERALEALEQVKEAVDFAVVVDYSKIPCPEGATVREVFEKANRIMSGVLKSIILTQIPGWQMICIDWLDFAAPFECSTGRIVCVGVGEPKEDGIEALESALDNPLYGAGIDMRNAEAYFLSVAAGDDVPFSEVERTIDYFMETYASGERKPLLIIGAYRGSELEKLEWTVFVPVDTCLDI